MANPTITGNRTRTITAIILACIGIGGSIQLLRSHLVTELTFFGLAVVTATFGVLIAFIDRAQSFGSKHFKVEFARVEEARKDVEAREARVRRIAHIVSEIALFSAAFQHRNLGDGDAET